MSHFDAQPEPLERIEAPGLLTLASTSEILDGALSVAMPYVYFHYCEGAKTARCRLEVQ